MHFFIAAHSEDWKYDNEDTDNKVNIREEASNFYLAVSQSTFITLHPNLAVQFRYDATLKKCLCESYVIRYRLILSLCIARIVSTHLIALPSTSGTSVGVTKAVLWVVPRTQNRRGAKD